MIAHAAVMSQRPKSRVIVAVRETDMGKLPVCMIVNLPVLLRQPPAARRIRHLWRRRAGWRAA
jgi:hypothetical protein